MIRVTPTRMPGRPGYVAYWIDPTSKKKVCRGISTNDEVQADIIAAEIQRIVNTPKLLDPNHPDHLASNAKAYRAVFMRQPPQPRGDAETTLPEWFIAGHQPPAVKVSDK